MRLLEELAFHDIAFGNHGSRLRCHKDAVDFKRIGPIGLGETPKPDHMIRIPYSRIK